METMHWNMRLAYAFIQRDKTYSYVLRLNNGDLIWSQFFYFSRRQSDDSFRMSGRIPQ
jgi:hypothetical protein